MVSTSTNDPPNKTFTGGGYLGGPPREWVDELQERAARAEAHHRVVSAWSWVAAGLSVGTVVIGVLVAAAVWERAHAVDKSIEICNRHILWNMPVEGGQGQVTAPSRQYLTEWNERCRAIEALAAKRALTDAAERERADKAFVDSVVRSRH